MPADAVEGSTSPEWIDSGVLSWAPDLDRQAREQALRTSRLPIVNGHVALMPDAHLGLGATIGSVIPTRDAIIPAAVGVDIGCGMVAGLTSLRVGDLDGRLDDLLSAIERAVPAGVGGAHRRPSAHATRWLDEHPNPRLTDDERVRALRQFGTLGSGNHFLEVDVDERDRVWVILHSGSRGVGNRLAEGHIAAAKRSCERLGVALEDRDLAYLSVGQEEFRSYLADMRWAQRYAMANREWMLTAVLERLFTIAGGNEIRRFDCHHNFATLERHGGGSVWITRKGAIRARLRDLGILPGSMGTVTYVVRGLGNPLSYRSCAHGAGRRMSRHEARRRFSAADLERAMGDRTWRKRLARSLVDEIPDAYKDVSAVMEAQRDLARPIHELRSVLNYKGA
jgi:tRNA-splicing ligase RtcB